MLRYSCASAKAPFLQPWQFTNLPLQFIEPVWNSEIQKLPRQRHRLNFASPSIEFEGALRPVFCPALRNTNSIPFSLDQSTQHEFHANHLIRKIVLRAVECQLCHDKRTRCSLAPRSQLGQKQPSKAMDGSRSIESNSAPLMTSRFPRSPHNSARDEVLMMQLITRLVD